MDPLSTLDFATSFSIDCKAVLSACLPTTFVLAAIWPSENTIAFAFVIDVVTDILAAILPSEVPLPMLHIIFPQAIVVTSVYPLIDTSTVHRVIDELPKKLAAIRPVELTLPVLLSLPIVTFEDRPVGPHLFAIAMVLVIDPKAFVVGTVHVRVSTHTIGPVFLPVADIYVSIAVNDAAEAFLIVVDEVAVVARTIWPRERASPMSPAITGPFASVTNI